MYALGIKKEVGLGQNGFYVVFNSGYIHVEQKMLLLEMFWGVPVHLLLQKKGDFLQETCLKMNWQKD